MDGRRSAEGGVFASRLKHSRYALVTRVADQHGETLVRTLAENLEQFGRLTLMAVFDRPGPSRSARTRAAARCWIGIPRLQR